jgi:inorganic triphosphatase YgiF
MTEIAAAPGAEVELKFAIGSDSARSAAGREVGQGPARSVETIYFDTPQRRLKSAGYSLRLRRDGENWSQSVKGNDSRLARFEQDHPLRGGLPDFSLLEGTPIAAMVNASLSPVFVTRVERRSKRRAASGGRIEFSLDEGQVIAHNRTWPILELELELKDGRPEALFDEGRRLVEEEAFVPAFMSKAERGYALADGILGEPVKFGSHPLDSGAPASEAFRTLARRCLRQLTLNADLIAGGGRLEAVHQARTALRRLRVALGLFDSVIAGEPAGALEQELRWLTTELGPARNLDVFMFETFQPGAEEVPDRAAAAAFGKALRKAHAQAHARARAAVAAPRFRLLLLEAAHWLEGDVGGPTLEADGQRPMTDFAADALEKRRKNLSARLRGLDWSDPLERHKARIAAKKMRYASEFFVGLGPKDRRGEFKPFIKVLEKLQDDLGALNDRTVAQGLIPAVLEAGAGTEGAEKVGYVAGLIVGRSLADEAKLAKSAKQAGRAFSDAQTWW